MWKPNLVAIVDPIADRGDRLADQFLVVVRSVDLGGVDQRHALIDRVAQHADHVGAVAGVRPVALRHPHRTEADGRHVEALSECSPVHDLPSFRDQPSRRALSHRTMSGSR